MPRVAQAENLRT